MNERFADGDLSADAFLGGRLILHQPRDGYRAGIDPVLLAASVPARTGESLLDLGCGAGAAMLCCARRVEGLRITGLELQPAYADLAGRNAAANGLAADIVTGDIADMPEALRKRQFDHIIANPPYFDRAAGTPARDAGRNRAMAEGTPLDAWVRAASKRAAPKGSVTFIQRTERLPELLNAMAGYLGSMELLPLIPRAGRPARLALLRGRKGGRAGFRLHHGWLLHEGPTHPGDRENYTPATACILREGGALPFPE